MSLLDAFVPVPARGVVGMHTCEVCSKPEPEFGLPGKGRPLDTFAPDYFCQGHALVWDMNVAAREAFDAAFEARLAGWRDPSPMLIERANMDGEAAYKAVVQAWQVEHYGRVLHQAV